MKYRRILDGILRLWSSWVDRRFSNAISNDFSPRVFRVSLSLYAAEDEDARRRVREVGEGPTESIVLIIA